MTANKEIFDVAVIGAGLMGTAAARHLVAAGARVVLIGPREPEEKATHRGVFASHYDQARISRKLDSDSDWSRLSEEAINRYPEIERAGDQPFFKAAGSIMAGPEQGRGSDFIQNAASVGKNSDLPHEVLRGAALEKRFPFFSFPAGILALYETSQAGWINPRMHVMAQLKAARAGGAQIIRGEAKNVVETRSGIEILCSDGSKIRAHKAIVACGAFSVAEGLLPQPLPMKVFARTVTFFEISEAEQERLARMPSVVYLPPDLSCDPYILPPVRYWDDKVYIKIGGDPEDVEVTSQSDLRDWFKGDGDERVGAFLRDQLLNLMPDLDYKSISYGSCATSFTSTGKPLIYRQTDHLFALTGGNGAGAKCADELGRLGAKLALTGSIEDESYEFGHPP